MEKSELLKRPARLHGAAAELWDSVAPQALKDGRLTDASRESFTVYCEVRALSEWVGELLKKLPSEFEDPQGDLVVHPIQVFGADLGEAETEIAAAIGTGVAGRAYLEERGGELGSLVDARFNRPDARDHPGPLLMPDDGEDV